MQETWIQSLIQEDPTYCRATKPIHHNYWACALELMLHNEKPQQWEAHAPQLERSSRSPQLEKSPCSSKDPARPQINKWNYFLKIKMFYFGLRVHFTVFEIYKLQTEVMLKLI